MKDLRVVSVIRGHAWLLEQISLGDAIEGAQSTVSGSGGGAGGELGGALGKSAAVLLAAAHRTHEEACPPLPRPC